MPRLRRKTALLANIVALLVIGGWFWWIDRPVSPPPPGALSALARPPDWSRLDPYQGALTRAEFELLLVSVFTTGEGWRESIRIDDAAAAIDTGEAPPHASYRLAFRTAGPRTAPARYWRTAAELPPAPAGKPLAGVRVAIDPGHIGGEWADVEERNLVVGKNPPVREGDLTLAVAKLLKPRLEALGATVLLVRETTAPLTKLRPADLLAEAAATLAANPETRVEKLANRLFYRTAEIRARADLVNDTLKPDLVLCLHFNADAWGSPANPLMVDRSHLHLLVNGAYADAEVRLADQRFALLHKLLQGTHAEETLIASAVATTMAAATSLPPFKYPAGGDTARPIPGEPYVWARNLLANRLYECPVVYTEPYVMNSRSDYARILAGDYDGLRSIGGTARPSIFREYADSLAAGLARHFSQHRPPPP
jgi:N-acetylmuramoyl-L-alanine amidase